MAMGGQGLGLAIVRMIARYRAARAAFVRPEGGFATIIETSWRECRNEGSCLRRPQEGRWRTGQA